MNMEVDRTAHQQAVLPQTYANKPRDVQQPSDRTAEAVYETQKPAPERSDQQVEQLVDKVNQAISRSSLKFRVEQDLHTAVIEVVDTQQNRVIRQIPSDEALARLQQISDYLRQHVYNGQGTDTSQHRREELTGLIMKAIS